MGRSGRKNNQAKNHLRVGLDSQGVQGALGETDSFGKSIGFIDPAGYCWESVWEHDLIQTEVLYDQEMTKWEQSLASKPDPEDLAEKVCLNKNHSKKAAAIAQRNRDIRSRLRSFVDEDGKSWPSVWEHDQRCTADAFIDAMEAWEEEGSQGEAPDPRTCAEENCLNADYVDMAAEKARQKWEELGVRGPYPGIIPGSQIDVVRGSIPGPKGGEDEFTALVGDLDSNEVEVWQGNFSYHVDALGHTVTLSTVRSGFKQAYEAGRRLEEAAVRGELYTEDVVVRVAMKPQSPEEQRDAALERLAEGKNRKELRILEALGLNPETAIRRDEDIVAGRYIENPLALVEASVFLPDLGEVHILASGRSEEEALSHLHKILPGATFS